MNFKYSSITRTLLIQQGSRVKTYINVNLFDLDKCINHFENSWGYR